MKKYDKLIGTLFILTTIALLVAFFTNNRFFDWAYERHQNQMSWYLRPIFIIPYCYFAYKRSWAGLTGTVFFLLTSMFWFPAPETVSEHVKQFLAFEKTWLNGKWDWAKISMVLLIPLSLLILALAFWKRSLWMGLAIIICMALGKIVWSVSFAGQAGKSILAPALIGLTLCCILVYVGFKRLEKKKAKRSPT